MSTTNVLLLVADILLGLLVLRGFWPLGRP